MCIQGDPQMSRYRCLMHLACLVLGISWFTFFVAIFMALDNGDKRGPRKRQLVQGMLDETDPFNTVVQNIPSFASEPPVRWRHLRQ